MIASVLRRVLPAGSKPLWVKSLPVIQVPLIPYLMSKTLHKTRLGRSNIHVSPII